ncbi:MAG TPA: TolC family protein [Gemmatimonadaceae bacterium]|nr:TolC family protein [Gemmatimonadaceae bacterium]
MFLLTSQDGSRRFSRTVFHALVALGALGALVTPVRAGAQAVAASPPALRLGPVLDAVERANPRLDAARAVARAARARVPSVTRPPDPQLQLGWMNFEVPSLRPMETTGMTQLQLMQMVPVAGKLKLAGAVETTRADATATRVAEVSFDLRVRTSMVFYDLYATDGALGVARETRRLLQDIEQIAGRMYQVGEGRQADVLRAGVELARMQEEIIRMETMRTAMAARLNALLVQNADAMVGAPQLPVFLAEPPSLDSLTQLALQNRPMLRAGAQDVESAEAAARLARREIWPDLQLGAQLGRQPGLGGGQSMASLMVGASLPVFAKSRQLQMREEADAMRAMAAADLASMRTETRGAAAVAHADLMRARRLADLYRTAVLPQAEATVTSSLSAYRVGTVNFMTLLDAQMTLNRYREELFTLEADEGKAWAELEMLTGRVLVDAHTARPARPSGGSPK